MNVSGIHETLDAKRSRGSSICVCWRQDDKRLGQVGWGATGGEPTSQVIGGGCGALG